MGLFSLSCFFMNHLLQCLHKSSSSFKIWLKYLLFHRYFFLLPTHKLRCSWVSAWARAVSAHRSRHVWKCLENCRHMPDGTLFWGYREASCERNHDVSTCGIQTGTSQHVWRTSRVTSGFREGVGESQEHTTLWWEGIPLEDLRRVTSFTFRGQRESAPSTVRCLPSEFAS